MTLPQHESESNRVKDEVLARLRARGVDATEDESSQDLILLLEAVEGFERTVQRAGGDLMVDEPIGTDSPVSPDDRSFVLPTRQGNESITDLIGRIAVARDRASHAHRPRQ